MSSMRVLDTGELAGWLAEHAAGADRVGLHPLGHWRAGTGDVTALAFATEAGAAYVATDRLDPADEQALATWLADPARPKVLHDAKGPMLGSGRAWAGRWSGWSVTPRCRRTSPVPTSAPTTSPT